MKLNFERNAILHGTSLFVNLPKQFVESNLIEKGNVLQITWSTDKQLIIEVKNVAIN